MSDIVTVAIVAGVPPTILALGNLIVSIRNSFKIETIHAATNSMKDALVQKTDQEAFARGAKSETDKQAKS